jgi:hypothetical protein
MPSPTFTYPEHLVRVEMASERLLELASSIERVQRDIDGATILFRNQLENAMQEAGQPIPDDELDAFIEGLTAEARRRLDEEADDAS